MSGNESTSQERASENLRNDNALRDADVVRERIPHTLIRQSYCRKCRGHGNKIELKGHATKCPYHNCSCKKCSEVMKSRSRLVEQRYRKDHPNEDFVIKEQKFENGNTRLIAYPKIISDDLGSTSISNGSVVMNWDSQSSIPSLASLNDSVTNSDFTNLSTITSTSAVQNTGMLWNYPDFLKTTFQSQSLTVASGISSGEGSSNTSSSNTENLLLRYVQLMSSQVIEPRNNPVDPEATPVPINPFMNTFSSKNLILSANAPSQQHPRFQMFLNVVADLERTLLFRGEDPSKK
ncbi:unnamed protein product [Caenorhabditis brenneri]